jgi:ADP-ribosylglycohydrolase
MSKKAAVIGCIIGTAIGDAMGLPVEGLSKRRQSLMYPEISGHYLWGAAWFLTTPNILVW